MANVGYIINESPMTSEDTKIVSEKGNRVIAEGTLQDLGVQNRNSRIYEAKELAPELTCARTKELLRTGNMKGENGHPMSKDLTRQQTIDPNNTVVKFLKFWIEGNLIKAQYKGCNNRLGEEFNADLLDGELPSFSLRALGGLDIRNGKAYVKNVKLITYDRVIYPSHKVAYTERIIGESAMVSNQKEFVNEQAKVSNTKLYVDENYNGMITPITNESVLKALKYESATVRALLQNFDVRYNNMEIIPTVSGSKVQMYDESGNIIVVNLERHVHNEIMDYCASHLF